MLRSPSGGGYGPPWERPVEQVVKDVREGFVTRARARQDYGVVLGEDGSVDPKATERQREELRSGAVG